MKICVNFSTLNNKIEAYLSHSDRTSDGVNSSLAWIPVGRQSLVLTQLHHHRSVTTYT